GAVSRPQRHPLVVDLDLLLGGVVVDGHLLAADDRDPPHLHWVEPAHPDVGHDVARELQVDLGQVRVARHDVRGTAAADAPRPRPRWGPAASRSRRAWPAAAPPWPADGESESASR